MVQMKRPAKSKTRRRLRRSDSVIQKSGPNQRIGEARDRAVSARKEADKAAAKALSAKGDEIKRQADVEAASLDEQSRAIRDAADKRAAALKEANTEAR